MATPEPRDISLEVAGSEVRLRWGPVGDAAEGAPAWELPSQPDWTNVEAIRLVSATFPDGAALAVAALRPRDARGHGDDAVVARFVDAEGLQIDASEALVSVEYDAAQRPRRLGIELWPESDAAPLRIAADRESEEEYSAADGREVVRMTFRLDGIGGRGTFETLRQG